MDTDKVTPCCHETPELQRNECTSEFWGHEVTERWSVIVCPECGSDYEPSELLELWEVDGEVAA